MKQTALFSENNFNWLAQFDSATLLAKMLELCDSAAVYSVNKDQEILYWNRGMEKLSGLRREDVVGKSCRQEYVMTEASSNQEQLIKIGRTDGSKIEVKKVIQVLPDKEGAFAGGIGWLRILSEPAANDLLPKVSVEINKPAMGSRNFHGLLSRAPAMRDVFQIIENAAETEANVLVRGESGAGKELVAKAIHTLSARHNAPFLAINCAALSANLLESELFGHVRGAFTGAVKDHKGLFQRAQGGTLFLDEVAELPLELQAKLLRVIQERNYIPVGGDRSIDADVRIVAATHRSLREEVKSGHFREDLMYRLRVVPIFIPPLRERREDIGLLIWHFISRHNAENFRKIEKIEPQAMRILLDYPWPGNIRELHNVVEYAFAVGRGPTLRLSELPPEFRETRPTADQPLQSTSSRQASPLSTEQETAAIRLALEQSNGKVTSAASSLGMSRATFWRKRKLYGI
ncbi:PAS modulated sigma54 specific transcriptional regulator, Fis family [Candidatus Methylobacter favarea]|uniref:PAS modulated sigma54 specific transcriptional regulator, Fis family n=1 Tax=Candidatus Methylobacter favarea TaxID=2707345 RepID=A0A8S0XHQ8_9GAMM|nr:sigma 54-interacting transcriptional regulator [Candidatus Methylobacter favarea]CAA9892033.1 PAS modulated sigma54 specific transcriptional regulator, Fis family [Candidatus Methylobacter favarea]